MPDDPQVVQERTNETTTTYLNPDGSYTSQISSAPVNYETQPGEWAPIDNELVPAEGLAYDVENAAGPYELKIPEDASATPVKVSADSRWVTFKLHGLDDGAAVDGSTATFDGVHADEQVAFEATGPGLKESITLTSPPVEPTRYVYDLEMSAGLAPRLADDETLEFVSESGAIEFSVPPAFMFDAAASEAGTSTDVPYTLEHTLTGWRLTMTPDHGWMSDPAREYPVVIDPTLQLGRPTNDCWLTSSSPNDSNCSTNYVRAGYVAAGGGKKRILSKFDLSALGPADIVQDAKLNLYLDATQTVNAQLATYGVFVPDQTWTTAATWNAPSGGGATWTGGNTGTTSFGERDLNGTGSGYKEWNITGLTSDWVKGTRPNRGIVVRQFPEAKDSTVFFYSRAAANPSARWPTLTVNYLDDADFPNTPTELAVSPGGADYFTSSEPTLSARVTDPNGGNLRANFEILQGATTVWSGASEPVPSGSVAQVDVDGGALAVGKSYTIRARGYDGTAESINAVSASMQNDGLAAVTPATCDAPCVDIADVAVLAPTSPLAAGETRTVSLDGVPFSADLAETVHTRLAVEGSGPQGTVTVFNPDYTRPIPSTMTYLAAGASSTTAELTLSADGGIAVRNNGSQPVQLSLIIDGWTTWVDNEEAELQAAENDETFETDDPSLDEMQDVDPYELTPADIQAMDLSDDLSETLGCGNTTLAGEPRQVCIDTMSRDEVLDFLSEPPTDGQTKVSSEPALKAGWPQNCRKNQWSANRLRACQRIYWRVTWKDLTPPFRTIAKAKFSETHYVALDGPGVQAEWWTEYDLIDVDGPLPPIFINNIFRCSGCNLDEPVSLDAWLELSDWHDENHVRILSDVTYGHTDIMPFMVTTKVLETGGWETHNLAAPSSRCDKLAYVPGMGCIFKGVIPTFALSESAQSVEQSAAHIKHAQEDFLPSPMGSWDLGGGPLHRHYWGEATNKNRNRARTLCKAIKRPGSCDEYPFASTDEGCWFLKQDHIQCSVDRIPLDDNTKAGRMLATFYRTRRVIDSDAFYTEIRA